MRLLNAAAPAGLTLSAVLMLSDAGAAPPTTIRVQGYVSDRSGGTPVPANGSFQMTFRLFDSAVAGTLVAASGPAPVQVTAGLYNTDVVFPPSAFNSGSLFLEVQIGAEVLTPRIPVVSVPYAYLAAQSASVAPGGVGSASIAPGAVTPDKLAPCADGQALLRDNGAWACVTICHAGDALSCYDGTETTVGVGTCHAGRRPCDPSGAGFGDCLGEKLPSPEICDGLDNDCNGIVDDNFSGFADCDHNPSNGCEANLSSPTSCGACGNVCLANNATNATCNGVRCSYACNTGFSDCNTDGPNTNGCECATPICCGSGCGTTHANGLGQNFVDCIPPGVPGNPATYSAALAAEARSAWPFTGTDQTLFCSGESAAARLTAGSCAVWVYTGTLAGHVHLNAAAASCLCVSASDPTWY